MGDYMTQAKIPYLKLDPEVEAAILEDRSSGWKNPYAFKDEDGFILRF